MNKSNPLLIEILGVSKNFKNEAALKNINVSVKSGEFIAIVGHSGSGKSTLLRMVTNLVKPDSGKIIFEGQSVSDLKRKELRKLRTRASFIFQDFGLVPTATALENVLMASLGVLRFPRWGSSTYPEKYRLRAKHLLTQFGLNQQIQQKAKDLSGGQMQRVAIARAMLLEPLVILADEPIASLDPVAADEVMDHLKDLNANGTTVLVSLHQVAIAMKYAQRLVGLKNGRVIIDKKTSDLTKEEVLEIYRDLDE